MKNTCKVWNVEPGDGYMPGHGASGAPVQMWMEGDGSTKTPSLALHGKERQVVDISSDTGCMCAAPLLAMSMQTGLADPCRVAIACTLQESAGASKQKLHNEESIQLMPCSSKGGHNLRRLHWIALREVDPQPVPAERSELMLVGSLVEICTEVLN
jgi:hypothetical protein